MPILDEAEIIAVLFTSGDSGSLVVVYLATSAAPVRVSAPIVEFAAGASAQAAAFSVRQAVLASPSPNNQVSRANQVRAPTPTCRVPKSIRSRRTPSIRVSRCSHHQ